MKDLKISINVEWTPGPEMRARGLGKGPAGYSFARFWEALPEDLDQSISETILRRLAEMNPALLAACGSMVCSDGEDFEEVLQKLECPAGWYFEEGSYLCKGLRTQIEAGNTIEAVNYAFKISSILHAIALSQPLKKFGGPGLKTIRALRLGADRKAKSRAAKSKRERKGWKEVASKIRAATPGRLSKTAVATSVKEELGLRQSVDLISRHI